jgi:hypothetical protein
MLRRRVNRQVRVKFVARRAPGMNATKNDIENSNKRASTYSYAPSDDDSAQRGALQTLVHRFLEPRPLIRSRLFTAVADPRFIAASPPCPGRDPRAHFGEARLQYFRRFLGNGSLTPGHNRTNIPTTESSGKFSMAGSATL